ncbi:MAG: GNAT family N-acetyltransferase [Alphaproteobacteria bacterium]
MAILVTQIDARTRRPHLRPPRENYADRLYALFNNWEVMRGLSSPPWPYTLDDARAFVRSRANGDGGAIGGAITLDGELIGIADVIVKPASMVQRERGYSLGYWLGEPYWGNGFMTEAVGALLTHVFATIPEDTIYSGAFAGNAASLRIQEKLGFACDGEAMFFSNPHRKDVLHVNTSLTRAGFAASSAGQATG